MGRANPGAWHCAVHALFALILIVYPASVLLNLNKAIEFSDTGFYYNSFANMDQIREQTTQFAVVWNLLPIPDSIVLQRLTSWLLIVATSALLASQAWKLVWPKRKLEVGEVVILYAFGAGAASLQHFWWLPDPSYNSIGYILNAGSLALTFRAIRLMLDGSRVPRLTILGLGALIAAEALVRPPTARALAAVLSALILVAARPNFRQLGALLVFGFGGALACLVTLTIFVEPLKDTIARVSGGLERQEIFERRDLISERYRRLRTEIWEYLSDAWFPTLCITAGAVGLSRPRSGDRAKNIIYIVAGLATVGGWTLLLGDFYRDSQDLSPANIHVFASLFIAMGTCAILYANLIFVGRRSNLLDHDLRLLLMVCGGNIGSSS